jgi:hypothetical protein
MDIVLQIFFQRASSGRVRTTPSWPSIALSPSRPFAVSPIPFRALNICRARLLFPHVALGYRLLAIGHARSATSP